MENITNQFPKSARIQNTGMFQSNDDLAQGRGKSGKEFVENYDKICEETNNKKDNWVNKLRALGVKAAHPDDGWHNREEFYFGLSYPSFNDEIKVGDMVALGDFKKFVIVIVDKISGILSKKYHYKPTIHI